MVESAVIDTDAPANRDASNNSQKIIELRVSQYLNNTLNALTQLTILLYRSIYPSSREHMMNMATKLSTIWSTWH